MIQIPPDSRRSVLCIKCLKFYLLTCVSAEEMTSEWVETPQQCFYSMRFKLQGMNDLHLSFRDLSDHFIEY